MPKRKHVKTLDFWKGERPVYARRPSSGQIAIQKVVKMLSPPPQEKEAKKSKGEKKRAQVEDKMDIDLEISPAKIEKKSPNKKKKSPAKKPEGEKGAKKSSPKKKKEGKKPEKTEEKPKISPEKQAEEKVPEAKIVEAVEKTPAKKKTPTKATPKKATPKKATPKKPAQSAEHEEEKKIDVPKADVEEKPSKEILDPLLSLEIELGAEKTPKRKHVKKIAVTPAKVDEKEHEKPKKTPKKAVSIEGGDPMVIDTEAAPKEGETNEKEKRGTKRGAEGEAETKTPKRVRHHWGREWRCL